MRIVLASQSPRRKQLLEMAEVHFEIITADIEETFPEGMQAEKVPAYIALNKAIAVANTLSALELTDTLIIAADTVVILDNEIIGKPQSFEDAKAILSKLSGKAHKVVTGVVFQYQQKNYELSETTYVYFNELSAPDIEHYVAKYKPMDKAGAYAIQEWIGAIGISKIEGDFYNVMGLPINKVVQQIAKLKH